MLEMHENPVEVCGVERRVRVRQSVGIFVDLDAVGGMRGMDSKVGSCEGAHPKINLKIRTADPLRSGRFLLSSATPG
jgi:hypothetical protein